MSPVYIIAALASFLAALLWLAFGAWGPVIGIPILAVGGIYLLIKDVNSRSV